jgi:hypothetical protein
MSLALAAVEAQAALQKSHECGSLIALCLHGRGVNVAVGEMEYIGPSFSTLIQWPSRAIPLFVMK